MWSDEQWQLFVSILARFASRDPLTPGDEIAYRTQLDGVVAPELGLRSLRELTISGQVWRPTPSEILARCRRDPSLPVFETEVLQLLFGRHGVTRLQPAPRGLWRQGERDAAIAELVEDWMQRVHPIVAAFVQRYGLQRLRELRYEIEDLDNGHWRRKELQEAWTEHVDAFDGREVAAIAAGTGRQGMRQLDPLAGLPELDQERARAELAATAGTDEDESASDPIGARA